MIDVLNCKAIVNQKYLIVVLCICAHYILRLEVTMHIPDHVKAFESVK